MNCPMNLDGIRKKIKDDQSDDSQAKDREEGSG